MRSFTGSRRRGFTLVELLVAVVLVDVGLLALVTGTAVLVRRQNELRARAAAVRFASNRLQLLAASACAPASGSAPAAVGVTEWWSAESRANHTRELRDSVAFTVSGVERSLVLRTRLVC
jgi:prepilin-type N-terminal cleavage/methylation domain-containing protein